MVISGRRLSPQEQFLEEIEDDEARTIVRRCLIPTSRFQMSAEIGKGIHCPKHFFPASRMYIFVALLVYVRRVMAFTVGSYICWLQGQDILARGAFTPRHSHGWWSLLFLRHGYLCSPAMGGEKVWIVYAQVKLRDCDYHTCRLNPWSSAGFPYTNPLLRAAVSWVLVGDNRYSWNSGRDIALLPGTGVCILETVVQKCLTLRSCFIFTATSKLVAIYC